MARRNIFQPPALPSADAALPPASEPRPRFPNTGAMSGVKSTLRDLSSNAVRDIDPVLIDDSGPKDRLDFTDADVAELLESIRLHGQQVPIMVRPIAEQPGHYRIVYGRRRLRALRRLGIPAKALVRSLTDEQAVLAQGQENSLRLDPSFIEKALFASELSDAGYEAAVILEALAIDRPMLSRMAKVARVIPAAVAEQIGPAHGVGRRRWEDLADLASEGDLDLAKLATAHLAALNGASSDERFAKLADAAATAVKRPGSDAQGGRPALPVTVADGTQIAEIRETPRSVTIRLSSAQAPEFTKWMRENAAAQLAQLYDIWKSGTKPD